MADQALIICPLQFERRALRRALGPRGDVVIVQSGAGPERARQAAQRAATNGPWRFVALVGVAGALRPMTERAAIAHTIIDEQGNRWTSPLVEEGDVNVSVSVPVATAAEKEAIRARTGGDLVDCESGAFARACEEFGLRWAVVRGVSDGPDDDLPPEVLSWTDDRGALRLCRLLVDLLRRPSLLGEAMRLGRRSKRAMRAAAELVEVLLDANRDATIAPSMKARADIPIPDDADCVLMYGGSFDPPHRAHIELPRDVRDRIDADWLLYMPSARSPLKVRGPIASEEDRLEMVRLAVVELPKASVSDLEIQRGGASYTIDTLRALRERFPERVGLRFLIGADQAIDFHKWRDARAILELASPVVMLRTPPGDADALIDQMSAHWSEEELRRWRGWIAPAPTIDVSSTEVRQALRTKGPDAPELKGAVPEAVLDYIRSHDLYFKGAASPSRQGSNA